MKHKGNSLHFMLAVPASRANSGSGRLQRYGTFNLSANTSSGSSGGSGGNSGGSLQVLGLNGRTSIDHFLCLSRAVCCVCVCAASLVVYCCSEWSFLGPT